MEASPLENMALKIANPFLRGFHPDPSILRHGEDYYVVTSTFEWFPGFQIYHSRDLRKWRLVRRPLDRISQLDLAGAPDSCGVWAPCLSEHQGVFYLLYTNVRSFDGPFKDTPNYLVTSTDLGGEWSEPTYLNSSGFDPSLFHDDDGRSWLTNMVVDHRGDRFFGGIVLQEYDRAAQCLIGPVHHIFEGTSLGRTEGPHLYKRDGYYYLLTAEGGTGREHAVTLARSPTLTGPYEVHPDNPVMSTRDYPNWPLQKTGHGDLVETPDGEWYLVFLASRPLPNGRCTLGRESCIERIEWRDDGWPYLTHFQSSSVAAPRRAPRLRVEVPASAPAEEPPTSSLEYINFDDSNARTLFHEAFQSLRVPMTEDWINFTERPGCLRLYGRESLGSTFRQSLVARRVQAHRVEAETCLEFAPQNFQQMAGLVCYYNTYHYHYLHLRGDDFGQPGRRFLDILTCDKYHPHEPLSASGAGGLVDVTDAERLYLKVDFDGADLQFHYASAPGAWRPIGPVLDGSILSDDYVEDIEVRYRPCFTGAFIGLCCQDLSGRDAAGRGLAADFHFFAYRERGDL